MSLLNSLRSYGASGVRDARRLIGWLAVVGVLVSTWIAVPAPARPDLPRAVAAEGSADEHPGTASDQTDALPRDWSRSTDILWTVRGDVTGLHLLVAEQRTAYTWRTVATLSEPGLEADSWIGNACLTESGRRAVVTYAPRAFVNDGAQMLRGGFNAVVDLRTGAVDKLAVRSTLAYFSPGCGAGEQAVVTQMRLPEESGAARTRLHVVNAARATVTTTLERAGQLTSALPTDIGVVAARGRQVVRVQRGGPDEVITTARSVPGHLSVDRSGGLAYLSGTRTSNGVSRLDLPSALTPSGRIRPVRPETLASARGRWLGLEQGSNGSVFVVGRGSKGRRDLGHGIEELPAQLGSEVSSTGDVIIEPQTREAPNSRKEANADGTYEDAEAVDGYDFGEPVPVELQTRVLSSGERIDFSVRPGQEVASGYLGGQQAAPAQAAVALSPVTGTVDTDRWCSVPRNDPKTQVYQPTPRQVEWAADQAVVGNLMTARPANWKKSGLASWTPQKYFPLPALLGGGRIPVQILLGILAQESNLKQATYHARPGVTGNPLIGNFYGRDVYSNDDENVDPWLIRWDEADCGYGLGQITDGMRATGRARPGEVLLPAAKQRAVALDYQTNVAAAAKILAEKWNQLHSAGILHDNGDPASIENWTFAVWAYNSGFYPDKGDGQPWGVGWLNNPANPIYEPNRNIFHTVATDAVTPNKWPYQERVLGFAAYPIGTIDSPNGVGYRAAWWVNDAARLGAQPPNDAFCAESNDCFFGEEFTPNAPEVDQSPAGPCAHKNAAGQYDLKCWWHESTSYNDCDSSFCGHELLRFNDTYPEQPDGTNYPPVCTTAGLPTGALILDDVPASAPSARPGCAHPWTDRGTFAMSFADRSGRVDFHQIGAGFGGHFWFAHTRTAGAEGGRLKATGTWTFNTSLNKWARVMVHIPDHGAHTQQAGYDIRLGPNGPVVRRHLPQRTRANTWVSLGVFKFTGAPRISLSTETFDGNGGEDVAWDAVAVQPLPAKPKHFVAVLGDSYTSGEGAGNVDGSDYYEETDVTYLNQPSSEPDTNQDFVREEDRPYHHGRNACHRSKKAWSRKTVLNDSSLPLGARSDAWDVNLDFQFRACSGAQTENLLPYHSVPNGQPRPQNLFGQYGQRQHGELSQLDQGYLDANTTLVLLSIGGNDARFSDIIKECIYKSGPVDCHNAELPGETEDLKVTVPAAINGPVRRSIEVTVKEIAKRAPQAQIVLLGYPLLIEGVANEPTFSCVDGIGGAEGNWINQMGQTMSDMLQQLVGDSTSGLRAAGYKVWYSNPISAFAGRSICGSPESVHGLVWTRTESDKPCALDPDDILGCVEPSAQSFHPKESGTDLYRNALQTTLRLPGLAVGP